MKINFIILSILTNHCVVSFLKLHVLNCMKIIIVVNLLSSVCVMNSLKQLGSSDVIYVDIHMQLNQWFCPISTTRKYIYMEGSRYKYGTCSIKNWFIYHNSYEGINSLWNPTILREKEELHKKIVIHHWRHWTVVMLNRLQQMRVPCF